MPQLKQNLGALALILSLPLLSSALTLPLMPFSINELLLPGQTRYCHLYEALFLSLLEYSLAECDGQVVMGLEANEGLLSLGILGKITDLKKLDVGAGINLTSLTPLKLSQILPFGSLDDSPFLKANCTLPPLTGSLTRCSELYDNLISIDQSINRISEDEGIPINKYKEMKVDPRAIPGYANVGEAKVSDLRSRSERANDILGLESTKLSLYSFASYLTFSSFPLVDKIKVLSNENLEGRLMDGCRVLGEREREVRAKMMLKGVVEEWEDKN